jgi:hypothetical protein
MKKIMQIAMECDTRYNDVYSVVRKLRIKGTKSNEFRNSTVKLDKYQEELVHQCLYFEGKITELTLESKMNYESE